MIIASKEDGYEMYPIEEGQGCDERKTKDFESVELPDSFYEENIRKEKTLRFVDICFIFTILNKLI